MESAMSHTLDSFLCIPILVMGLIKTFSFLNPKHPNLYLSTILSGFSFVISIAVLVLIFQWPDLKFGGDSVPCFYLPLGLSTVFPGVFEVLLLRNLLTESGTKSLWVYISLSSIGKMYFSLSIPLSKSWPYEILTLFLATDYLFLAATCILISRRSPLNGPSHVVLVRRALDFIGVAICASIFTALGIRDRSIWAALTKVLVMLATAFISHAQPTIRSNTTKPPDAENGAPCIQTGDSSQHDRT